MNFSSIPFFNTAVAVIITWALFAILCSLVHEAIAQVLAERGRFMKNYLFKQLKDQTNGFNWASLLYMNGSVSMLTRDPAKPTNDISPKRFAESIVDATGKIQAVKAIAPATKFYTNPLLNNLKAALSILNPSDVTLLLIDCLASAEAKASSQAGVLNETEVYNNLIQNIENWYFDFTGRLTLWYKKRTRKRLFLLGLLVAVIINLDSIKVFSFYRDNPVAATTVMDYYQKNKTSLEAMAAKADTMKVIVISGKDSALQMLPAKEYLKNLKLTEPADSFLKELQALQAKTSLPVGTDHSILLELKIEKETKEKEKKEWSYGSFWFWKILGLIITGFAASFGGPFWFDVLRKVYTKS